MMFFDDMICTTKWKNPKAIENIFKSPQAKL